MAPNRTALALNVFFIIIIFVLIVAHLESEINKLDSDIRILKSETDNLKSAVEKNVLHLQLPNNLHLENPTNSIHDYEPKYVNSTEERIMPDILLSQMVFYLSLCLLIFGLVVIIIEAILSVKNHWDAIFTLRVIGLTLIIIFAVVLIPVGYSETQTAPVFGLLGMVAGYLLGTIPTEAKNNSQDK